MRGPWSNVKERQRPYSREVPSTLKRVMRVAWCDAKDLSYAGKAHAGKDRDSARLFGSGAAVQTGLFVIFGYQSVLEDENCVSTTQYRALLGGKPVVEAVLEERGGAMKSPARCSGMEAFFSVDHHRAAFKGAPNNG